MSTILKAREDLLKRLNVMVRRIEGVTSFALIGDAQCPPSDVNVVLGCSDDSAMPKIYSDINFLITEFLSPVSFDYKEADGRIVKIYMFESQVRAKVYVCAENNFPNADWWVSYLDQNGAAQNAYAYAEKCMSDPVRKPQEASIDDFTDDFDDDFDDGFSETAEETQQASQSEPEPLVVSVPPVPAAVIETSEQEAMVGENSDTFTVAEEISDEEPQPEQNNDALWEYVYGRVALAKRAIAGGSIIHASEIVNELRTELIKLICQKNGINDNYIHSIDLLSNEYQKELVKTYPARPESGAVIAALAAELSLFEQLIK